MIRKLSLIAFFVFAWGGDAQNIGEINADFMSRDKDNIVASGNVVLINEDIYISAKHLKYNIKTQIADIEGNVKVYKGGFLFLNTDRAKLDLKNRDSFMEPMYLQNTKTGLWVSADKAENKSEKYFFKQSIISGCSIENPVWYMKSSSGSYDQNTYFASLWNSRIYLLNIPVFYVPYMSFSTYNQRTSGLLYPRFAFSSQEGFTYMQPVFIAPQKFWDMTITPQVRTNRGYGLLSEFRIANRDNEVLKIDGKFFRNTDEYVKNFNLKNQNIYGVGIKYKDDGILGNFWNIDDGLYIDYTYMNDIDYLRVDSINRVIKDKIYASRVNYFLQGEDNYVGIYTKFFTDLSAPINDETFQVLPNVQYHKYMNSFFIKELMYSIDMQSKNIARSSGYGYLENNLIMPIGAQIPVFKNYAYIGIASDLMFSNVVLNSVGDMKMPTGERIPKSANYMTANYSISVGSDLARKYSNFFHVMQFEGILSGPYYRINSRALDDDVYKAYGELASKYTQEEIKRYWNPRSVVDFYANKTKLDLKLSQYFHNKDGRELFYYILSQRIGFDDRDMMLAQNLKNEIGFSIIDGLNVGASAYYSHTYGKIEETSVSASYSKSFFNISANYYFNNPLKSVESSKSDMANFLRVDVKNDFGYFAINANAGFDVFNSFVRDWYVEISKDIRCFGVSLKFADERTLLLVDSPDNFRSSNSSIRSVSNKYVKFEFRFTPVTSTGFSYRFKK